MLARFKVLRDDERPKILSIYHVAAQRVDVDALHRTPMGLVVLVHPATSTRLAQIDPVRRSITGTAKLRIDQRL